MADVPQQPPTAPAAPAPEASAPEAAEPSLHPAEIRRLKREAQEAKRELEQMRQAAQAAKDAELSEIEKLRKQVAEFEGYKGKAESLTGYVSSTAAEMLASLPESARSAAEESIAGLDPLAQVKLLKTFAKLSAGAPIPPPKPAPGARSPLAPRAPVSGADLSSEDIKAMTVEQRRELLAHAQIGRRT